MYGTSKGFTLIELMIAMTLGLIVVGVVTTVFVDNSKTLQAIDESARHMENGRYAMQMLRNDIQLAGFFAEYDPKALATPAAKPDPCSATTADISAALPIHIQGYDNSNGGLGCLLDVKAGTDVVVVRRTSTCTAGVGSCDPAVAGTLYFQASHCNAATELASLTLTDHFALDTDIDPATTSLTKHQRDCVTPADLRRMRVHIYFVANNGIGADGIPTLKRWELGGGIVPLVEGIEDLQLEYGIDGDHDGAPDSYTADPDSFDSCATHVPPDCVENWRNLVAIRVHLLARAVNPDLQYTDTKTYQLGLKADGTADIVGPFNDNFRRNEYNSLVVVKNVAGRREQ